MIYILERKNSVLSELWRLINPSTDQFNVYKKPNNCQILDVCIYFKHACSGSQKEFH
jgi:hypothetical protein